MSAADRLDLIHDELELASGELQGADDDRWLWLDRLAARIAGVARELRQPDSLSSSNRGEESAVSVFKTKCFMFLRDPHGGVEDLDRMQAAGFDAVFCNIGDHDPAEWEAIVRPRALQRGMACGPWLRTTAPDGSFSRDKVETLVACAERWASPFIVNSESELQGTGESETTWLRDRLAGYDWALSMEPQPFDNVAWWPLKDVPVLPQYSSAYGYSGDPSANRDLWQAYGVDCAFPTFGTFGAMRPADYVLKAPYSLYTADDCGGDYAAWSPTGYGYDGCVHAPDPPDPEPPDGNGGETMTGVGTVASLETAWDELEASNADDAWRRDNPKELQALTSYWSAPAGTPAPTTIKTHYGKGLLAITEARRYAEGSHG